MFMMVSGFFADPGLPWVNQEWLGTSALVLELFDLARR
jgi:hypothetical protein